ncbi:hypothetical protein [Streptomyces sp. C36]|uniref:hypothetical protein n=1 Tax=Streptomyces sp. C36 TaxID=3237122 RepID=UPI0034C5BEFD
MVTRPNGKLELPGGVTALDEPAVDPAAYHLRRLGLDRRPGPILLVDHMEPIRLSDDNDRLDFIFYCGKLTPAECEALGAPGLPDDVTAWRFVNLQYYEVGITAYHRRCLNAAVTACAAGTGSPYLRNGLRINAVPA